MGRLKDQLIDRPRTIGDARRQGAVALQVRCAPPCRHIGRVTLDTLRLPDDTAIRQIPKLRRLRCAECERCAPDLSPILPPAPVHVEDSGAARWTVVTREADGREGISSPLWSQTHAERFADEQRAPGVEVLRIEGPDGDVVGDG